MSAISLLLQVCAIDWYFVDGDDLRSKGRFVYPSDMVEKVAENEQAAVPHLYYDIRCEEQ